MGLAIGLVLFAVSSAFAEPTHLPPLKQIAFNTVDREDGLPSTQVHAIAQGPDGALWLAGPAGVARYDGSRVSVMGPRDGLTTQGTRSLTTDSEGTLWVGHDHGIDQLLPSGAIRKLAPDSWRYGFSDSIIVDAEGAWIGSSQGLVRWHTDSGEYEVSEGPEGLISAVRFVHGEPWATGPGSGPWVYRQQQWQRLDRHGWEDLGAVNAMEPGPEGTVWVGGLGGVVRIDRQGRLLERWSRPRGEVTALLAVEDELWVAWAGTLDVYQVDGSHPTHSGYATIGTQVNDLKTDNQGNIWVATDSGGVLRISALRHAIFQWHSPCETRVFAVRKILPGGFLVAGEQCSWRILDNGAFEPLPDLDRIIVWDLIEGPNGEVWAATQRGLLRGVGGRFEPAGEASRHIPGRALLSREDGLWIATVRGLFRIDSGGETEILDAQGQSFGYVYTLVSDSDHRIWLGTLGRSAWTESRSAGQFEPLIGEGLTRTGNIYAIAFHHEGPVALIQDDAVRLQREQRWIRLDAATESNVGGWSLLFDEAGALWVGSSDGLLEYESGSGRLRRRLTSSMGLSGDEFTTSRSLARLDSNLLLLGLDSGLSILNPKVLNTIGTRPVPHLSQVTWAQAEFADTNPLRVAAGPWTLEAWMASSWFVDEHGLRYRHMLEGFDRQWSEPHGRTSAVARYTGLPAGHYRLQAQVFSPLFGWGPSVELLTFEVDPPWWGGTGMVLIWILLAAGLVALTVQWRTTLLRRRAVALKAAVRQRTRQLREANQELKRIASRDSLTGLMNRRAFWIEAERYRAIAARQDLVFGLILMDLDHFKSINDSLGHPVGDEVLCHVGRRVNEVLRTDEIFARWGGEEFAVLLAPTPRLPDLMAACERIRNEVASSPLELDDGKRLEITCSLGACPWRDTTLSIEALISRADEALYEAKRQRNQSVVWSGQD